MASNMLEKLFNKKISNMKKVILFSIISFAATACSVFSSLTSNTTIKPNERFVLGDNEHGKFTAKLTNVSNYPLEVYMAPIGGGTHSKKTIQPRESFTANVAGNTALIIENTSQEQANVEIRASGDLNLGMGYKSK